MSLTLEQMAALTDEDWGGANPLSPAFRADPYPALAQLRERDPVNLTPLGIWRVTRFDDVAYTLKHAPTRQTLRDGTSPNFDPLDRRGDFHEFMLNKDGEEHLRLRRLVIKAFTGRAVARMEQEIRGAVTEALDRGLANGGMDIIEDLALYVPSRMTCRIMGIPDADRLLFTEWAGLRTRAFWARYLPPDEQAAIRAAGASLADYFEALVRERRRQPGEDLLSELIRAEEDGERLREGELVVQAVGLLVAGYETTIGLIGNGIRALLEHPAEAARVRAEPALVDNAVEECLRYDTPVVFNWRILREAHVIGGCELPADAVIWVMLGAANRDPARFAAPDRFDVGREDVGHVSFGGGAHFCLGHQLARMEGRAALGEFCRRAAAPRLEVDGLAWSNSFFRVLGRLPVSFH